MSFHPAVALSHISQSFPNPFEFISIQFKLVLTLLAENWRTKLDNTRVVGRMMKWVDINGHNLCVKESNTAFALKYVPQNGVLIIYVPQIPQMGYRWGTKV